MNKQNDNKVTHVWKGPEIVVPMNGSFVVIDNFAKHLHADDGVDEKDQNHE